MSALGSADAGPATHEGAPSAVRELAAELLARTPQLADSMTDHLFAAMPELGAGDDELRVGEDAGRNPGIGIGQTLESGMRLLQSAYRVGNAGLELLQQILRLLLVLIEVRVRG